MATNSLPVTWQIGEHIAAVGDTGTGKTYLVSQLVKLRQYVVIYRTKPDDIKFPGFVRAKKATALDNVNNERILLTPDYEQQPRQGYEMLEAVWHHGNWTVVIDELWYAEQMGLRKHIERLLTQGRSKGISVIVGMQRPAQVSRFAISQCTHLFTFRTEGRDTKTIAEATTPRIIEPINELQGHNFVYFYRKARTLAIGNARQMDRVLVTRKSPAKVLTPT
jgi:hypothetical protein